MKVVHLHKRLYNGTVCLYNIDLHFALFQCSPSRGGNILFSLGTKAVLNLKYSVWKLAPFLAGWASGWILSTLKCKH